jgi:hypothetical protein
MSNTRDLTGLNDDQIAIVDRLIAELREGPDVEYEDVGTLLIDLRAGEGSFDLDMESAAWLEMGTVGQLDIMKDWASLFQELYETSFDLSR